MDKKLIKLILALLDDLSEHQANAGCNDPTRKMIKSLTKKEWEEVLAEIGEMYDCDLDDPRFVQDSFLCDYAEKKLNEMLEMAP